MLTDGVTMSRAEAKLALALALDRQADDGTISVVLDQFVEDLARALFGELGAHVEPVDAPMLRREAIADLLAGG